MKFSVFLFASVGLLLWGCSDREPKAQTVSKTPSKDLCFEAPPGSTLLCEGSGTTQEDLFHWNTHLSDQPFAAIVDLYEKACHDLPPTKAPNSVIWRTQPDKPLKIIAVGTSESAALPLSCEKPPPGKTIIVISNRSRP